MVIGSSKKSSYGANTASCAGGWTWVIKFINSSTGIKVRLLCLRRRVPQTWITSAAFSPPPPSSSPPPPISPLLLLFFFTFSSSYFLFFSFFSSSSFSFSFFLFFFFFFREQPKHFHRLPGGEPVLLVYGAWVQPNPYCFPYEPIYAPGFTDQNAHIVT
jgi:hypothetical protein